jgi:hypothetical protein
MVLAAPTTEGMFISVDGGNSWVTQDNTVPPGENTVAVSPHNKYLEKDILMVKDY